MTSGKCGVLPAWSIFVSAIACGGPGPSSGGTGTGDTGEDDDAPCDETVLPDVPCETSACVTIRRGWVICPIEARATIGPQGYTVVARPDPASLDRRNGDEFRGAKFDLGGGRFTAAIVESIAPDGTTTMLWAGAPSFYSILLNPTAATFAVPVADELTLYDAQGTALAAIEVPLCGTAKLVPESHHVVVDEGTLAADFGCDVGPFRIHDGTGAAIAEIDAPAGLRGFHLNASGLLLSLPDELVKLDLQGGESWRWTPAAVEPRRRTAIATFAERVVAGGDGIIVHVDNGETMSAIDVGGSIDPLLIIATDGVFASAYDHDTGTLHRFGDGELLGSTTLDRVAPRIALSNRGEHLLVSSELEPDWTILIDAQGRVAWESETPGVTEARFSRDGDAFILIGEVVGRFSINR